MQIQKGGNLTSTISILSNMLAPLGKNALATLIVVLSLHALGKKKTRPPGRNKQKGGMFNDYFKMFYPLGKNELLTLASLLLLHFYTKKKHSKQSGGYAVMKEIGNLLAPLGVDALGTSIILLLLNKSFSKRKSKKQVGGSFLNEFRTLVAPLGVNMFLSTGVLVILAKMFDKKQNGNAKSRVGESMTSMKKKLMKALKSL